MRNWFAKLPPGLGVSLALAVAVIVWLCWRTTGWQELEGDGRLRQWRRGNVLRVDDNRDGIVDEEITTDRHGHKTVKRDTNHDGWFDLEYELGTNGSTQNVRAIHERAPRH